MLSSLIGLPSLVAIAWLISENRQQIAWRVVGIGIILQILLALILLKWPAMNTFFLALNEAVLALERATVSGTSLVFGFLGGGELPFDEKFPGASYILAFRALPLVIVVSALSSLLFYWKILPLCIRGFSYLMQKTLKISGAVGVATAANIFVGMVEAPVLVRPYLQKMNRSELFMVMTCGMATVAGTVMVLYASILAPVIPNVLGHIFSASIISAPASIVVALVMVPNENLLGVSGANRADHHGSSAAQAPDAPYQQPFRGAMDAITQGAQSGLTLFLNIMAMLIVFVALVSLVNEVLGFLPAFLGEPLTLQRLLGLVMAPVMWLIGVPWVEAQTAGALMGTKTVLNEFVAYLNLSQLPAEALSEKSRLILLYAMCGFANFGSLGIMIGGLSVIAPERRSDILSLGGKSIIGGTLATLMTGAIVGALLTWF